MVSDQDLAREVDSIVGELLHLDVVAVRARATGHAGRPRHYGDAESRSLQIVDYSLHVFLGWTLARTAAAFGRNKSTVWHSCHKVEDLRDLGRVDELLEKLEDRLSARGVVGRARGAGSVAGDGRAPSGGGAQA